MDRSYDWTCQYGHAEESHWSGECYACRQLGRIGVLATRRNRATAPLGEFERGGFRQGELVEWNPPHGVVTSVYAMRPGCRGIVDSAVITGDYGRRDDYLPVRWLDGPHRNAQVSGAYELAGFRSLCPRKESA